MGTKRVQQVALEGLKELPVQFIRPADERPENTKAKEGVQVPVVSLIQSRDNLVRDITKACSEWGFFLLTDHGVSPLLIQRLQAVGEDFFNLPPEEKERYANDPVSGKLEGYGTKMTKNHEQKLEWIDYYFHLTSPPSRVDYQTWPKNPPSYKEVTEEYTKEVLQVNDKILELLSEGLGLESHALKASLGEDKIELEMKINMYPPCPQPELALGVEPHTDMSATTILVPNDVPGLQVWKDEDWVAVQSLPNAFFVHIGDQLEVLSNGNYKSVLHRSLVSKELKRMSWAVFFVPPHDAVIGPHPSLVNYRSPPKYSTKTYGEFRYCKLNKIAQ